jgi:hypothetical protein
VKHGFEWIRSWEVGGREAYRVGRSGTDLAAEWPGFCRLLATRDGQVREIAFAEGVDAEHASKFHRGPITALLRHARGELTLHASGVAIGGVAVALLGESGEGKSTLAAELCRDADAAFVADDTIAITIRDGDVRVVAHEEVCWLDSHSRARLGQPHDSPLKQPWIPPTRIVDELPLAAIVQLVSDDTAKTPQIVPLVGAAAFLAVARSLFRFVVDEPAVDLRDFDVVSAIASRVVSFELHRQRSTSSIGESARAIRALLADGLRCHTAAGGETG